MQIIDNCGLACPEPVIRTKKALAGLTTGAITSVVDNEIAKENVLRLANSLGLSASVEEASGIFHIKISKGEEGNKEPIMPLAPATKHTTMLIKSDLFGEGEQALGQVLMKSFLHALNESTVLPREIFFVNGAVKLTCTDSAVLSKLQSLEEKGVQIFSCGTCLDFYHLQDKLAIGEVTNMFSIVECLTQADHTITI